MKRIPCLAVALTLALAGVPAPGPAHATSLQKCQTGDGSIGYTDGSCKVFGSDSVLVSSHAIQMTADTTVAYGYPGMERGDAVAAIGMGSAGGRRSPADGCARTPTQLAMDLRASLALGDVNRVAESYHWAGMGNEEGQRTMDRLQRLVGHPVLDSRYFDASYGMGDAMMFASAGNPPADAGGGQLQLLLGDDDGRGADTVDFDVHHYAGCYFVSF
jgi:hypothetical protein